MVQRRARFSLMLRRPPRFKKFVVFRLVSNKGLFVRFCCRIFCRRSEKNCDIMQQFQPTKPCLNCVKYFVCQNISPPATSLKFFVFFFVMFSAHRLWVTFLSCNCDYPRKMQKEKCFSLPNHSRLKSQKIQKSKLKTKTW